MAGSPGIPIPTLGSQLFVVLLRDGIWILALALLVLAVTPWVRTRHPTVAEAVRRWWSRAPGPEPRARTVVRVGLGLLWIVAGLLQMQPAMPASFVPTMLDPGLAQAPPWLSSLIQPLADVWTAHPVVADALSVWTQLGLGVLILVGGTGVIARAVLWASLAWAALVWVAGEMLGGLLLPGATWLTGAPGSVAVYAIAAGLLLAPWHWWTGPRAARVAAGAVGAWMLVGAVLQALPAEGSWTWEGLGGVFAGGAATAQPAVLARPIAAMESLARAHPPAVNATVVVLLVAVGLALLLLGDRLSIAAGLMLCAVTWWLAQDFGVLGGTSTDPNSALPLGLLLFAAWQAPAPAPAPGRPERGQAVQPGWRHAGTTRAAGRAAAAAFGVAALLLAPTAQASTLFGPADAAAALANSGGGVQPLLPVQSPPFALVDQNDRRFSSSDLHGYLTLLTFFDPVCSENCPVIANQLAAVNRELGPLARRVQIVAVNSNPVFTDVRDVSTFTTEHNLEQLPNWHFVTGPLPQLRALLNAYQVTVAVPSVGMVEHSQGIYFISPDGTQLSYLPDGADPNVTTGYVSIVLAEVRRRLG